VYSFLTSVILNLHDGTGTIAEKIQKTAKGLLDTVLQDCTAKLTVMRRLSLPAWQSTFLYRTDIQQSLQNEIAQYSI
jgi:hypothetical protein